MTEIPLPLLLPDGSVPDIGSREKGLEFANSCTWTLEKKDSWVLELVDQDDWMLGSTRLFSLSQTVPLNFLQSASSLSPIATANIYISGLNFLRNEIQGKAVLTEDCVLYTYGSGLKKYSVLVMHDDIVGVSKKDAYLWKFIYSGGVLTKNKKYELIKSMELEIGLSFSRDGHANRRNFVFMYSLEHLLKQRYIQEAED